MASPSRTLPRQKAERLEVRVTSDQKRLIERAAVVQGRSVTDFMTATLQDAAKRAIQKNAIWDLSQEQQHAFVDALLNPPAPNERLQAAAARYEAYTASQQAAR